MNCLESEQHLQKLLDGDGDHVPETVSAHLAICPECRELFLAARLLKKGLRSRREAAPPQDLAQRTTEKALLERRNRLRWRAAAALTAVAATLLLAIVGGYLWYSAPQQPDNADSIVEKTEPAPTPDKNLPPEVGRLALRQALDPPARTLARAGQTLSNGLEPVTSSARRAVNLFMREIEPLERDQKGGS